MLVLIGGGGHARAVADVAKSAGFDLEGVLSIEGTPLAAGLNRLGDEGWIDQSPLGTQFHIAFGPRRGGNERAALFRRLMERRLPLPTIIAPTAIVSASARIGEGTVVMHSVIINAGAEIHRNCIINTGALVEHDCSVGDHTHIAPRAVLAGGVRVGSNCLIGSGAIILPGISIAEGVTIGAGAVVVRAVEEPNGTWSGNPARRHQ
jgi:UDP-perosamine 4-acetyltransferase